MDNRYEEALKRARQEYNATKDVERKQLLEELFPELKSEYDERIRKECISIINAWAEACRVEGDYCEVAPICIAWLEKQADKDKLIKELGEYKVKYTQEVLGQQLEKQVEQKPAAWSKDDEAIFQSCTGAIWAADYYLYDDKKDMEAWLESLKNRVQPQPKQEWSEEDEKMLGSIIEDVDYVGEFPDYPTKLDCELKDESDAKIKWLESMKNRVQPQVKEWSEEDDAYKLFAISAVEDYYDEENPLQKGIVDWLKSLKDRVSWKPSKEQMDALLGVMVESGYNYIDYNTLESLYDDLKKL